MLHFPNDTARLSKNLYEVGEEEAVAWWTDGSFPSSSSVVVVKRLVYVFLALLCTYNISSASNHMVSNVNSDTEGVLTFNSGYI